MAMGFGIVAFALFGLYDLNQVLWKNSWLRYGFFLGFFALIVATVLMIRTSLPGIFMSPIQWAGMVVAALCFAMLLYVLFLALPFSVTYRQSGAGKNKKVYSRGWYGICRHPGFLFFAGGYGALAFVLQSEQATKVVVALILMNFLYVLFQDRWTFPRDLKGYNEYRKRTPFLIPNRASLHNFRIGLENGSGVRHEI